ncbi:MAG: RnfABCDGE type electron transport complex subunit D [Planctomycetota bacterium]|jgi:electron transport complex protein RnfD
MLSKISVSPAPHISKKLSTQRVMLDVIIGLVPAMVAAVYFFRLNAVLVIAACVFSCMLSEWVCNIIRKKPNSLTDLSAVLTGIILALSLPPTAPWWMCMIGSAFAIIICKMLFGGLGSNVFNPAMAARVFLTASFGAFMTAWTIPASVGTVVHQEWGELKTMATVDIQNTPTDEAQLASVTQATPLGWCKNVIRTQKKADEAAQKRDALQAKVDASENPADIAGLKLKIEKQEANIQKAKDQAAQAYATLKDQVKAAFIGNVGGCLGETSSLALLIGGVYLLIRKTIAIHIPLAVLISAFVFAEIFYFMNPEKYSMPWLQLFGGGMLICAFFIATDPVTAPLSVKGMWIFGVGVGALIMLIRFFGAYEEGVMFAVLVMNAFTPLIDRACKLVPAGGKPNVN